MRIYVHHWVLEEPKKKQRQKQPPNPLPTLLAHLRTRTTWFPKDRRCLGAIIRPMTPSQLVVIRFNVLVMMI